MTEQKRSKSGGVFCKTQFVVRHMIPAQPGWLAVFKYTCDDGPHYEDVRVVAWVHFRERELEKEYGAHRTSYAPEWLSGFGAMCARALPGDTSVFLDREEEESCSNASLLGYRLENQAAEPWIVAAEGGPDLDDTSSWYTISKGGEEDGTV